MKQIVETAEQGVLEVRFRHFRADMLEFEKIQEAITEADSSGQIKKHRLPMWPVVIAATRCTLQDPTTKTPIATGYAFCSSKDRFSRPVGRRIALGRALKQLKHDEEEAWDLANWQDEIDASL